MAADQTWTNNDNDTLEFYNNGSGSAIDTNGKVLSLAGTGNFNLGAPISGAGSLTKGGAGTLTLNNAANSYTGDTTVNAGTLKLGVSGTVASANLIVGDAGSSSTVLDVTAKSAFTIGGTHAVGNAGTDVGVAPQTVTGNLNYGGTSIFEWDINTGAATYDKVALSGSLTVVSNAQFKVVSSTGFSDGFWSTTKSWSDIFGSNNLGLDTLG